MLFTSSSSPQPDRSTSAAQELPLGQLRRREGKVGAEVLDQDLAAEHVLHLAHPGREVLDGFLGLRQRQQVVEVFAARVTPAGVLADERGLEALDGAFHARRCSRSSGATDPRPGRRRAG